MEKKIRDIYDCEPVSGTDDVLVEWYNQVIEKTQSELTMGDAARCVRQKVFLDLAVEVLLAYLLENPLAGERYEGELMEKIVEVDSRILSRYRKSLGTILKYSYDVLDKKEWEFNEDKDEFRIAVRKLEKLIA